MTKREARRLALKAAAESVECAEPGEAWNNTTNDDFYDLSVADQQRFADAYEDIAKQLRRASARLAAPGGPTT